MIYAMEAHGSQGRCTKDSYTTGLVKFGKANDPKARVKVLATGCPHELKLLAYCDWPDEIERLIHAAFKDQRLHGEWFVPDDWMKSFVSTMMCPNGASDEQKLGACMQLLAERLTGWPTRSIKGGICRAPDMRESA